MKIWSATLTVRDLEEACAEVNHEFPGAAVFLGGSMSWGGCGDQVAALYEGPRSRRIDCVHLRSESGGHYPNSGTYGARTDAGMAASWTEWGWFIARVFMRDPNARVGDYRGVDDFDSKTLSRFVEPRSPRERQVKRHLKVAS